jgi:hypothetical protein
MVQPDIRHLVFQSPKEVSVISSEILDLWRCARGGFLGALQLNVKLRGENISSKLLACLEGEGDTLSWMLTAGETWIHHFEQEAEGSPWNGAILDLPRKEILSLCQQARSWSLSSEWISDSCGCDAKMEVSSSDTNIRMLTELRKCFMYVWPHKKSCFSMTVRGCAQVWCLGKALKNLLVIVTPSTVQLQFGILRFPPV